MSAGAQAEKFSLPRAETYCWQHGTYGRVFCRSGDGFKFQQIGVESPFFPPMRKKKMDLTKIYFCPAVLSKRMSCSYVFVLFVFCSCPPPHLGVRSLQNRPGSARSSTSSTRGSTSEPRSIWRIMASSGSSSGAPRENQLNRSNPQGCPDALLRFFMRCYAVSALLFASEDP